MAEATRLTTELMDACLAACVQIAGPGLSIYRWQGKVEQTNEYYLNIKTSAARSDAVVNWLKQHHPYDLPEIIRMECETTKAYADWVHAEAL